MIGSQSLDAHDWRATGHACATCAACGRVRHGSTDGGVDCGAGFRYSEGVGYATKLKLFPGPCAGKDLMDGPPAAPELTAEAKK